MGSINAYCKICGKGYHMCLSCKDYARLHPWQKDTDNEEHFKVFQILKGHTVGLYTDEEARDRLRNIDISDSDSYLEEVKDHLDRIMASEIKDDEYRPRRGRRTKRTKFDNYNNSMNKSEINKYESDVGNF